MRVAKRALIESWEKKCVMETDEVTSVFEFAKGLPALKSGSEPRTGLAKQIPVASRSSSVW